VQQIDERELSAATSDPTTMPIAGGTVDEMEEKRLGVQDPDARVYLAVERTFLAWIRTGLALMGFGFVVARFGIFLREVRAASSPANQSTSVSLWAGTALVCIGVIVDVASSIRYVHAIRDLNSGVYTVGRPSTLGIALAGLLALIGIAGSSYLIVVR
jgi:putative membrane protein